MGIQIMDQPIGELRLVTVFLVGELEPATHLIIASMVASFIEKTIEHHQKNPLDGQLRAIIVELPKERFLKWCGLSDLKWVQDEYHGWPTKPAATPVTLEVIPAEAQL